ncbi:hypothetical protein SAMN05518672_104450 [Chitinophaga sp. CF118]|uniref:hypothetical protein n=1 Tax=Chitinophaga sp. CF118 TaxID=1884367 RepID=UPI0008F4570B|nr:hypothetical protein [Chitinophaga sp. CF118]SFE09381.1 hypothetical protein SAMN05518672_104450 [Chitinophaga sp. CF118]
MRNKKLLTILATLLLLTFLFLKYIVGFNHIPDHFRHAKERLFSSGSSEEKAPELAQDVATDAISEVSTPASIDYPFDTTGMALSTEEIEKIKSYHYENLKKAKKAPNDEEAQRALIHLTRGRLTELIMDANVNIKVGKCYENPNTDGKFNCVSCMVFIYDRKLKDESVSEARILIKPAYDFYQSSENDMWDAKDISLNIPFDHKLFKQYSKVE